MVFGGGWGAWAAAGISPVWSWAVPDMRAAGQCRIREDYRKVGGKHAGRPGQRHTRTRKGSAAACWGRAARAMPHDCACATTALHRLPQHCHGHAHEDVNCPRAAPTSVEASTTPHPLALSCSADNAALRTHPEAAGRR